MKREIIMIIDRSGSMSSMASDVRGGFDSFIDEHRNENVEAGFTLVQFDDQYQVDYEGVPINSEISLDFTPRGMTALHDAIGKTIISQGERFAKMSEADRPEKVLVIIQTDGIENASKEYTADRIKDLIEQQTRDYNWEFMYLGANQDAIVEARKFGIAAGSSLTYGGDKMFNTMSAVATKSVGYTRSSIDEGVQEFSAEERTELS